VHFKKGLSRQAILTASDGATGDLFGNSVGISGQTAGVGAIGKSSQEGAAYLFVRSGTIWSQQAALTASDGGPNDVFCVVAISGSTVVVGAPGTPDGSFAGEAYVFTRSGTTWSQQAKLTEPHAALDDGFGNAVAITGSTVVIGANGTKSKTGAAYVWTGA
jgi:hypothetical protein